MPGSVGYMLLIHCPFCPYCLKVCGEPSSFGCPLMNGNRRPSINSFGHGLLSSLFNIGL